MGEAERKAKFAKMKAMGTGRSGGLARLGLSLEDRVVEVDPKKMEITAVDTYLTKDKGIHDASKALSAHERALQQKAITKGAKKAATRSALNEEHGRKDAYGQARQCARGAARAGLREESEDSSASKKVRSGTGQDFSAAL